MCGAAQEYGVMYKPEQLRSAYLFWDLGRPTGTAFWLKLGDTGFGPICGMEMVLYERY